MALIIGVSGPTRSGKTTLCRNLAAYFQKTYPQCRISVVHQDHHLRAGETPDAVCWRTFLGEIQKHVTGKEKDRCARDDNLLAISDFASEDLPQTADSWCWDKKTVIILEGFLLFSNPRIQALCRVKLFLALPQKECYSRRKATKRTGLAGEAFDRFFEKDVWASHVRYGDYGGLSGVVAIDATKTPEECALSALNEIHTVVSLPKKI